MKIISWNCNGAFRSKADIILEHKPDIVVVPECEHPDKLKFKSDSIPNDIIWYGDNQNKGLGVFSYSDYRFKLQDCHNSEMKIILPISVTGGKLDFTLFAVWTIQDKVNKYIEQVQKAIECYSNLLNESTILIGDFNSNTIFDKPTAKTSHSNVVTLLEKKEIYSLYHRHFNNQQGEEEYPTFFLQRNREKPFHIDYCFASADLADKLALVEIGTYDQWMKYSDHIPIIVTFDL